MLLRQQELSVIKMANFTFVTFLISDEITSLSRQICDGA